MSPDKAHWPWLTLQIIAANVATITLLALAWYFTFTHQSNVYSERLMSTFNIEPGRLHAMYVDDVERQLVISVVLGLAAALLVSIGLVLVIVRPLRSLAEVTLRLRHGDYRIRAEVQRGEVGTLAENFNALAEALESEEQRRAMFMADLGHELRTPIMSLLGYIEGLEDGVFRADEQYFKLITSELHHLTQLTHTIETMRLDAGAGDATHSAISINEVVQQAQHRWQPRFQQRGLTLIGNVRALPGNENLPISANTLKQIFDNLLSNMYRYADTQSPCRIDVAPEECQQKLCIKFSNEAQQVTKQTLPFLFDRFYRLSNSRTRTTDEQSSGLGLSVVKQLCMVNHGSVSASLEHGQLIICIVLPTVACEGSG